jgi:hypothetical protein
MSKPKSQIPNPKEIANQRSQITNKSQIKDPKSTMTTCQLD